MKLWTGRFQKELDKTTNDFNSSISFDSRMYQEDIEGSIAPVSYTHLSPLKQRRSLARDKLVAALEEALDTGIAVEEIHTLVEECNRKRGGNRNAGD